MVNGIVSLLNSLGVEMGKFTTNGVYGLLILAIFGAFWIVLYNLLSKKGENKNPLSKGLPPLIAFMATIALITDISSGSISVRSPENFLLMFRSFGGFIGSLLISGLLIWIGIISNRNLKNNWGKLILSVIIFFVTSLLLPHFGSDGFVYNNFSDKFQIFESLLSLLNVLSIIGIFIYAFRGFGSMGFKSGKSVYNWQKDVRSERVRNIKIIDDNTRLIREIINKGSRVYANITNVMKNKLTNKDDIKNNLNSWIMYLNELQTRLKELDVADVDKLKFRVNLVKTGFNDANKLKLEFSNLERILNEMKNLINFYLKREDQNIDYNQLYQIAMSWYNLAKTYDLYDGGIKSLNEDLKKELDLANEIMKKEKEIENLSFKDAKKDFETSRNNILEKLFSDKQVDIGKRYFEIYFVHLILSELIRFMNSEKYKVFKNGENKNVFEDLFNKIRDEIIKNYPNLDVNSLKEIIPEIESLIQTLFNDAEIIKGKKDYDSAEKELKGFLNNLEMQKEKFENFGNLINSLLNLEEVKKYFNDNNLFVGLENTLNGLNSFEIQLLQNSGLKGKENFLNSLKGNFEKIEIILNEMKELFNINNLKEEDWVFKKRDLFTKIESLIKLLDTDKGILKIEIDAFLKQTENIK